VPFLRGGKPINSKDASLILASSVYKDSICLAAPLRIVHDSRWADTYTIYFDIWDSQTGSRMKSFIDRSLNIGSMVCFFCKASMKIGVPLCICCYLWGHNMNYCNSSRMVCPICNGPHCEDTTMLLQPGARATPNRTPLFPLLLMENPAPTQLPVRIAANPMLLTPLTASSGNTVSTISGLWNDI